MVNNFFDNLFNGSINVYKDNHEGDLTCFTSLPVAQPDQAAAPQNPEGKIGTGGERLFRVKLIHPQNDQQVALVDLYVKRFNKPGHVLKNKTTTSYRIRAFKWDSPDHEIKARSSESFTDALSKLYEKVFKQTV